MTGVPHEPTNPSADDSELLKQAKAGDLEAFETLTARYERQIYTLALRMLHNEQDAEDVTQQSFISALEHLETFREEASFKNWLFRIATHAALKVIRKRKGLETVSLDQATDPTEEEGEIRRPEYIADWRHTPDRLAHSREVQALLDQALSELDEKHRLVFLMRDVEGLSVRETAEELRISEANVKVRLLRARLQLRERLTRQLGDPSTILEGSHGHHSL